jgi:hypothetical protein
MLALLAKTPLATRIVVAVILASFLDPLQRLASWC